MLRGRKHISLFHDPARIIFHWYAIRVPLHMFGYIAQEQNSQQQTEEGVQLVADYHVLHCKSNFIYICKLLLQMCVLSALKIYLWRKIFAFQFEGWQYVCVYVCMSAPLKR